MQNALRDGYPHLRGAEWLSLSKTSANELTGLMMNAFLKFLGLKPRYRVLPRRITHRVLLAETFPPALQHCIEREIKLGHEGVAYLFGQTDGETTIVLGAIRIEAETTSSSFNVSSAAVARVVRRISDLGLQL